jgi:hypothetical protein
MQKILPSLFALSFTLFLAPACDDGDDTGDDSQGDDGNADDDSGGSCSGPVTDCRLAELSAEQKATYCDTLLAIIDDEPGTAYECADNGLSLTLNTSEGCVASEVSSDCPITVGEVIDCYKAAKADACPAFAEDGACAPLFEQSEACAGG